MRALTQKERKLAIFAALFIAGWSLYTFALKPARARLATLQRVVPQEQTDLYELQQLDQEVARLLSEPDPAFSLPDDFNL